MANKTFEIPWGSESICHYCKNKDCTTKKPIDAQLLNCPPDTFLLDRSKIPIQFRDREIKIKYSTSMLRRLMSNNYPKKSD